MSQLNTIVQEQRDLARAQQEPNNEEEEGNDEVLQPEGEKMTESDSPSEALPMEVISGVISVFGCPI